MSLWGAESDQKCDIGRLHATDWPGSDVTGWVIRATPSQESNLPFFKPKNEGNGDTNFFYPKSDKKTQTGTFCPPCYDDPAHIEVLHNCKNWVELSWGGARGKDALQNKGLESPRGLKRSPSLTNVEFKTSIHQKSAPTQSQIIK